jgi:hypothetical protein
VPLLLLRGRLVRDGELLRLLGLDMMRVPFG